MSSTIEYERRVFVKDPLVDPNEYGNCFYAFVLRGDSNTFDVLPNGRNGRRSRDWQFYAAGPPYVVIQEVCLNAGYTEGGTLKIANNRWTKPENYIRLWRKAIDGAQAIDDMKRVIPVTHAIVYLRDWKKMPTLGSYDQDGLDRLKASDDWVRRKGFYDHVRYERPLYASGDLIGVLDEWLQYRHLAFVSGIGVL